MKSLDERLKIVEENVNNNEIIIMIIGLGSVGTYLLDFLVGKNDSAIKLVVVGRNAEKMQSDVNIVRVASLIREVNKSQIEIEGNVDLNDIKSIEKVISKHNPDFIVNSSRAYAGIKYGSISWHNVRAYGIWTPLSIKFTKNIMEACDNVNTNAIVISPARRPSERSSTFRPPPARRRTRVMKFSSWPSGQAEAHRPEIQPCSRPLRFTHPSRASPASR